MPGSVAVLSLGVLLAARPAPRLLLLVPPLLWIMTAPFSIWRWGLWEDAALPLLGAMGVAGSLLWRSRLSGLDVKDTVRFDF